MAATKKNERAQLEVKMNVRHAKSTDARRIAEVHVASWQAAYRGIFPDSFLDNLSAANREAYWIDAIAKGESSLLVFEQEGIVIGLSSFGHSRDEDVDPNIVGEIYAFYFDPQHWAKGYGSALAEESLKELTEAGYSEITLWVLKDNQRAIRFYQKLGFEADGTQKEDTWKDSITLRESRYRRRILPQE